jgi:hypothetical protein
MSKLHIANYQEAPRWSCVAAADMQLGEVIKITTGTVVGQRYCTRVAVAADVQSQGQWGIVTKVSADPFQVSTSSVPADLGNRIVSISTGDNVVQIAAGAIIEFDRSLFHSSLDPDRGGTLPTVGASLGVNIATGKALLSTAGATGLTGVGTTINVARVFRTFGTKVLVQLVESGA